MRELNLKIQNDRIQNELRTQNDIIKSDNNKQLKKDLNLNFDEENNIRCRGRLKNTLLNYSAKLPAFLPSANYFTNLVINFYQILVLHNGMEETMNRIRTKFWILISRNEVKRIFKKFTLSATRR